MVANPDEWVCQTTCALRLARNMVAIPQFTLNTGAKIPAVGLGVWMGSPGQHERAEAMCATALKLGYRAFDTASGYGNEAAVGRAIRASGVPRSEIFVTTKLGSTHHHKVAEAFETSLKALDIEYIDLYLIHWPQAAVDGKVLTPDEHPDIVDTWKDMEKLLATGKVKAIGVSNFNAERIQRLIDECTVVPAANQVELHPCLPQVALVEFCQSKNVLVTAYSSLGQPGGQISPDGSTVTVPDVFFSNDRLKEIATKHAATIAQVLLSWAVARGINVIPKSENADRLRTNATVIQLDAEETAFLDDFHKGPGLHRSLLTYHSLADPIGVFKWTYEQLGWPMTRGGFVTQ